VIAPSTRLKWVEIQADTPEEAVMADRMMLNSVDSLPMTCDAWDLVRAALAERREGGPANWSDRAVERLKLAVAEIQARMERVRRMIPDARDLTTSPDFASLATHLGLATARAEAVVEEGCEAA
jgi:hypothetical protein